MNANTRLMLMRELLGEPDVSKDDSALPVGSNVMVRCVTHYYTGRLDAVTPTNLVLSSAAWIADTGRWHEALRDGTLKEVEPYPDGFVWINRGAVVDLCHWRHDLPRAAK